MDRIRWLWIETESCESKNVIASVLWVIYSYRIIRVRVRTYMVIQLMKACTDSHMQDLNGKDVEAIAMHWLCSM